MALGFIKGTLGGALVSALCIGAISVLSPLPAPPTVGTAAPDAVLSPGLLRAPAGVFRGDHAPVTGREARRIPAPQAGTLTAMRSEDTAVAAPPEVGGASDLPGTPLSPAAPGREDPLPGALTGASNETALTDAPPQERSSASHSTPAAQSGAEPLPIVSGAGFCAARTSEAPDVPQPDLEGVAADAVQGTQGIYSDPAQPRAPVADAAASGFAPDVPAGEGGAADVMSLPKDDPGVARPDLDPEAQAPGALNSGSLLATGPAPGPGDKIGLSPVRRFAAPGKGGAEKPKMAIVLLDEGGELAAPNAVLQSLRLLSYPVSIAVDPDLPDAAERMRAYRADNLEVLAAVDLPEAAKASDAEVVLRAALAKLPEAVAVMEGIATGVQTSPDAVGHVTMYLAQSGHGFVAQNTDTATLQKLAIAGVPSAVIFRDVDGKDQDAAVIRRFLDRAAFRAGPEGGVILLGRLHPETISALLLWGTQDRAARVSLVPVSQVLQPQQP